MTTYFFQVEDRASQLSDAIASSERGDYAGPSLSSLMGELAASIQDHRDDLFIRASRRY